MKKLFVICITLLLTTVASAQEPMTYEKVIQAENLDKTSIYVALRAWFSETYNSAKSVIQMEDKDAGLIIGNATRKYNHGGLSYLCYEGYLKYTIKVQIKDGRYRAEITDIRHEVLPGNARACILGLITTAEKHQEKGMQKNQNNKVASDIKVVMQEFSDMLFRGMEVATSNAKKAAETDDDW